MEIHLLDIFLLIALIVGMIFAEKKVSENTDLITSCFVEIIELAILIAYCYYFFFQDHNVSDLIRNTNIIL